MRRVLLAAMALVACTSNPAAAPATAATTIAAVTTVAPTTTAVAARPRVLLIGDSTLLAVDRENGYRALRGFDYTFDAESCRTLGIRSCGDPPVPPNAVEAIEAAGGSYDYVVVMAGYDEWWTSFPRSFDAVVAAARGKGARHIIWLTYRENTKYKLLSGDLADEAFVKNNATLRDKVASGAFPDVVLAKWYPHTASGTDWLTRDGIHLTLHGALGVADYISRWVAHVEGLPCPMPREPGGAIEPVCSDPDDHAPIGDISELYEP